MKIEGKESEGGDKGSISFLMNIAGSYQDEEKSHLPREPLL